MDKYFLIGAPHCGKSTLGRKVAELLNLPFFDTDDMAQENIGETSIGSVFNLYANMRFRREQQNAVLNLAEFDGSAIVATGAEVALIPECVEFMQDIDVIIHIKRKVESILEELKNNIASRPVFVEVNNGTILDFRERAVLSYVDELPHYEVASNFTIDNDGSENYGVELLSVLIQSIMKANGD